MANTYYTDGMINYAGYPYRNSIWVPYNYMVYRCDRQGPVENDYNRKQINVGVSCCCMYVIS